MEEAIPEQNSAEQKKLRYIQNLEKHKENTQKSAHYSLERFDILIISLATATLGFSIGFIKDIVQGDFHKANLVPLKIAWFLLGFSVILNLVSQITSYWCSYYVITLTRAKIKEQLGNKHQWNKEKVKKISNGFNLATHILNYGSVGLFIAGMILIIVFVKNHI